MAGPDALPPAGVAPEEAIRFFRSKGFQVGFSWLDVFKAEHARAFTVAKAMSAAVLEDIRAEVDRAIAEGTTLAEFKKNLRPKLEARGWWGRKTMIDPLTAQSKSVQLGSPRRLKTIFNTNLRTAYAAGKWERAQRTKVAFPYLEYSSMMDGRERPQHHAWNGTILPIDDPWWDTHYPPCDWNCRCWPIQRSARMLERQGKAVTEQPIEFDQVPWTNPRTGETGMIEKGIGRGWDYNVGKEYLRGLSPAPLPGSFDGTEEVGAAAELGAGPRALVDRFLAHFDVPAGGQAIWTDREGWPLAIGRGWWIGDNGQVRLPKGAAGLAIDRIAGAIVAPDAIEWAWLKGDDGRALLFRRYRRAVRGLETMVDIGGAGWRWSTGSPGEIAAAYNPHQERDRRGRWSSRHGAFLASLEHGQPSGSGLHHLGDASAGAISRIHALGITVRSPAVWLEHGRARHALNEHGKDRLPIKPQDLLKVREHLAKASHASFDGHRVHGVIPRIRVDRELGDHSVHMVFEVRRRGLVLHTMYKRAPRMSPA